MLGEILQARENRLSTLSQPYNLTERRSNVINGSGPDRLTIIVGGRTEVLHRHNPGFGDKEVRVVSFGAHPDDTALSEGLEHVLVKQGRSLGIETGLAVISATDGTAGKHVNDLSGNLGLVRVEEDVRATRMLGADIYGNLGFSDGRVREDRVALSGRFAQYLTELDPTIIILPDPNDPAHVDHIAASEAVVDALLMNGQNPIVLYTDFQNGDNELGEDSFGFLLDPEEYAVFEAAFLAHESQTGIITDDIARVLQRHTSRAESLLPDVPYLGVARRDNRFSLAPLDAYLGTRLISTESEKATDPVVIYSSNLERRFREGHLVLDNPDLVAPPVAKAIKQWKGESSLTDVRLFQTDPEITTSEELCDRYDIPKSMGAKTVIAQTKDGRYVACVIPSDTRADLNGQVKKLLNTRRVSLVPQDVVEHETGMEKGSITVIGLPEDWNVLVDSSLVQQPHVVLGSGLRDTKLVMPGAALAELPSVSIVAELGKTKSVQELFH